MAVDSAKLLMRGAKRIGRSLLSGSLEALLHLVWISSLGVSQRLFTFHLGPRFTTKAITSSLDRLYRKGFISKIKKGRNVFIRLKRSHFDILLSETEKLKYNNYTCKWDGVWRLLVYDIPEKERFRRDALRRHLKEFGFGKIQGSCWVSPYHFSAQLHKFCESEHILRYICLYEGKFFAGKNIDTLVEEVWGLNAMNAGYRGFISLCNESMEQIKEKSIDPKDCSATYFKVYSAFTNSIRKDPFLPKDFLKGWLRDEAQERFDCFSRLAAGKILAVA